MRYSKFLIIFFIAFFPATLFAQALSPEGRDIAGLWKGTIYNDTTQKFYKYEIGISEEKGKLTGFSHTWFILDDKEYYGIKKVKIKIASDGKLIIEDAGLIANNYPVAPAKGVKQLNVLTLEIKDSIMILSGPYSTNRTKDYRPLTGTISLQRKNDFWQSALVPHLQELKLSNELSFVKRENDLKKAAEDKIAAEKDIAIQKEKTMAEEALAKKEEAIKAQLKNTDESKNIAVNTSVSNKETKQAPVKTETTSKDIAANTTAVKKDAEKNETKSPANETVTKDIVKQEPNKEVKPVDPSTDKTANKEITANTTPVKNESDKEAKTTSNETVTKDIVKKEPNKEVKQAESTTMKSSSSETITKASVKEVKTEPIKSNAPAAEVTSRTNVVQQIVYFAADSLQISLYDNGEVDGDTVSVLMNGQVIMAKEGLSTKAVRKTIFIPANTDSVELIMYAENLGTIAPNTGLLVVHDGKSIYEIRFSGDLKKNASIILRRRKT